MGPIKFTVLGDPKALKRHRTFRKGNFIGIYDPSKADKQAFLIMVQQNAPPKPFDEPLVMLLDFYFSRPKNHYRSGKFAGQLKPNAPLCHTVRPDLDNLIKFIFDSLLGVFYRDDTLIYRVRASKHYSENPRTEITLYTREWEQENVV